MADVDESRREEGSEGNDFPAPTSSRNPWVRHGAHTVPESIGEERLDRYLSSRFTYRTRTQWVEIIKSGRIQVNGAPTRPSRMIRPGTRIDYDPEPMVEPAVSFEIGHIFEDEDLLAIDKPGDLPVHPSGRYLRNTLLSQLLVERGQSSRRPGIRIVHRLDRETSGVIVFGKSRASTAALAAQFESRTAQKEYLLLVHGSPGTETFRVDVELGPRRGSQIRKAVGVVPSGEGRPAVTEFRMIASGPGHSLLLARPRTGRLHQIRVHAAHLGFPIVGDKIYGLDERFFLRFIEGDPLDPEDEARLVHNRQCLHAYRLQIDHPTTGAPLEFVAPLPRDLRTLAAQLSVPVPEEYLG